MKELTERQQIIFDFIKNYIKKQGYPPSVREVGREFRFSVRASYDHLRALKKKGYIRTEIKNRSRSIEVLEQSKEIEKPEFIKVPLLGNVAAGKPLFAEENLEGTLTISRDQLGTGVYFGLHVKGDSMKDAGILEGDIAIIRQQSEAENGEIIVAMIDESITIKRLYKEKNRVRLQPENPAYSAIYAKEAVVLGKLAFIFRNYEK